jgi:hypothetical protein
MYAFKGMHPDTIVYQLIAGVYPKGNKTIISVPVTYTGQSANFVFWAININIYIHNIYNPISWFLRVLVLVRPEQKDEELKMKNNQ